MIAPSKELLISLIAESPNYYDRKVKKEYPEWVVWVKQEYPGKILNESIYRFLNGKDCNSCGTCGKPTKWVGITEGFNRYCSHKCSAQNPETREKRNATSIALHGSLEAAEAFAHKNKEKTMVARYGVSHALQSKELKDKAAETLKANFGEAGFNHESIKNKRKATNLQKYRTEYSSSSESVKAKRVATNMERYGVDTPLRNRAIIEETQKRRREISTKKIVARAAAKGITPLWVEYSKVGELHPWKCSEGHEFEAHMDDGSTPVCPTCNPKCGSKGEGELRDFIASLGFEIKANDRTIIAPREIDILVPELKLGIEYHGLYWHSEQKVGEKYHLEKLEAANAAGYSLIQIFESEWLENSDLVKARLKAKMGLTDRVFARKCTLGKPNKVDVRSFLRENHIQGAAPSTNDYGLYCDGELLAVMTFGKSRYDKSTEWELIRFATKAGVTVVGGASKLLRKFEEDMKPTSLISYCDRRWNNGQGYHKMGFSLIRKSAPAYQYTQDGVILHNRVKFQKHKLENLLDAYDPSLTESENMANNGFYKLWDCGTLVFRKNYE